MKAGTLAINLIGAFVATIIALPSAAQVQKDALATTTGTLPTKDELAQLSKTNENHQLLASLVGTWSFVGKHIFPGATGTGKTFEFKGTIVRTPLWNGRYFITETTGEKLKMAWSTELVPYHEETIDGYDNVKKKFVTASMHNEMDTGIITLDGTYDSTTKTITYDGETTSHIHKDVPVGTKFKFHDVVKFIDNNHFVFERHEIIDGRDTGGTVLTYTRITK
jgi:hypothetical protein